MPASPRPLPRLRRAVAATRWPLAFAALVAAALALVGWGAHAFQVAQIRRGAAEQLTMMAELKRDQVEGWIAAQRRLALAVSRGTSMADALDRQLGAGGISDASGARWLPRLRTIQELGGFADVSLLRLDGRLVLSSREGPLPEPPDPAVVAEALRTGEPALSTVRREPALDEGALSMDLVTPVLVDGAGGRRAVGLLRFRIDPRAVLYPMLQAWPTRSDSAEIVLAQASADEVVFLSEVRHRSHVALALRVPRSARERLIVQAATGAHELLEGVDYRGVRVLGAARTLAGTRWLLIAKEDEAELFAPLWRRTLWTTAAAATLLAALALVLRSWLGQRAAKGLLRAEAAARAGQARVRAVLDNAGFGISITDREGRMLESNPEWARFLGYALEELEHLRIQEVTHPDDQETSRRNLESVYSGAIASYTQEKRYVRKDGGVVWGLLAVTPIRDTGGRVESVVGIVADITERKRIETELALVAERLSVATESAGIGIWDWDVKNDVLVWDDAMYRMYGLRREDFGGAYEAWRRAFDPADRQRTDENILAALRGEREFSPEFRVRWPDGSVHHIQAAARILRDVAGRPVRMVGVNFDITARKAAEEQLQRSKHFLEAVTDAVPGLVGYWDRDLRCQFANRQYLEWFGWSPEQMRGAHMREVLGEALFTRNEPFVRKVLAGEAQRFEQPVGPGGPSRCSWVHYIPDLSEGEVRGFFVLVSDITELKNAQHEAERLNEALRERTRQAEAASRAKSDFLANMSHEIRTPMNAIVGLSHLLQGSALAPKQRDYLARIQGAARSLLAIINDVLDLAKIEANRLEVEQVAFSLPEVFRHVEGLVAEKAREKGLELSCELPPDVPAQLLGDGLRLGQVLLNLLNNAVKFTEHGRVVMTARLVEERGDAVRLRFSIRDTGIGIPADALPRLFQPFSQADATTTRRFGGTGLGLSISRRLVELMGGELTVQSTPGQGSTFSFVIGLVRRRGESARAPGSVTGKRVLVVDDDPGFRSVAMELLSSMGMVLRTVGSGQEALAALLDSVPHPSQAFDVVLLDWRMPGLDGLETARRIREDLRLREQPVIILTTDLGRELEEREQHEALLDGVLLKPVEPDVFRDVLEEAFRRRQGFGYEPAAPVPLVPGGERRQGKVLVAEDNETNRLVVTELLRGAGIVVEEALNGREAVELALRPGAGFDLVLMDVQMPEMDGFEATARIREVQPRLPIVAMTAHAMENERQRALEAGMADHVAKPFEPAQIWAVLDRWLPVIAPAGAPAAAGPAVPAGVRSTDERFLTALGRDLQVCADRLATAWSAGDGALAAEAAHALKGLALPPASAGVRERARGLEQAVRGGAPWVKMAEALEGELRPLVEAARRMARPETAPERIPERASPAELRGLLQQTAQKIRRHSLGAKDHVDALRARIGSDRLLRRLEDCLDGVDFPAAEAALKQLAEAMGLDL